MTYELFLSYSRKDNVPRPLPPNPQSAIANPQSKGWVTALHDEILADHRRFSTEPLRIFFDTSEIADMDDWRHRILTGLRESRILLVCLSPDYFKSPPCLWEWEEYIKRQVHALMGQESVAPVYFVEAPDSDEQLNAAWAEAVTRKAVTAAERPQWEQRWKDWRTATLGRPNWVDLKPWFPHGTEALREAAVREKLAGLGTSLWERIQRARRATGVPGNLRRLNPHFIGRTTELRQLHEYVAKGTIGVVTAINGLGGQGKTELATAYAHGWADSYPAGLWVLGAEGKKEILPLLGELCAELQIPLSAGADETGDARGRRVLAELQRRAAAVRDRDPDQGAACLVLLDNVSEPALLAEPQLAQIPREDWLRVIVTTREGPEKFPASRQESLAFIAVDALSVDDAARLIEDHQPDAKWPAATAAADAAAAREIARELGGFTLAVESVAIYLGLHPDIRPAAYLARLRAEGLTGVDALPADADVAAQMQHREKQLRLVLDQTLARLTPPERTALDYAALLPPDSIPWPWLRALVTSEHVDALAARSGYPDPWPALRRRLEGLRLLTPGDHVEIARLHRMVAAHLAGMTKEVTTPSLKQGLIDYVRIRARFLWEGWEDSTNRWEIIPVTACAQQWKEVEGANMAELLVNAAGPLRNLGQFTEAEDLLRRALKRAESDSSGCGPVLIASLTNLAELLHVTNHMEEAESLLRKVLSMKDTVRSPDWRAISAALNTLGCLLRDSGRLREAEAVLRMVLADDREAFGSSHPNVARDANNLAILLKQAAHWPEAERLFRLALEIDEGHFGSQHLMVAKRLSNLAVFLSETTPSSRTEVASLSKRALEIAESNLPSNHPDLAVHLVLRARILTTSDRLEDGLNLYHRALAIEEHAYGPDHPTLAATLICIGDALMDDQRPAEAEPSYRRALAIRERSCSSSHQLVAAALNNLAQALSGMGRLGDAEQLIRRSLAILEKVHGTEHPDVAVVLNTLAVLLQDTKRLTEAEPLSRRHFEILLHFTTAAGRLHPHLLDAAGNYANLLEQMGHSREEADEQVFAIARQFGIQLGGG